MKHNCYDDYGDNIVAEITHLKNLLRTDVASIPTLLLFKNGKLEKTSVGFKPKAAIIAELGL